MIYDDESLIKSLKDEDRNAIKHVYRTYFPKLERLLSKYNASEQDTRDIMQLSILALLKNLQENKFQGQSKVESYFMSIAKLKWFTEAKRRKRFSEIELGQIKDEFEIEEQEKQMEIEEIIQENLLKLKVDCRRLLTSFYFHKKSMQDIANALNYTIAFVRVKKNRCMGALKKQLLENSVIQNNYPNA